MASVNRPLQADEWFVRDQQLGSKKLKSTRVKSFSKDVSNIEETAKEEEENVQEEEEIGSEETQVFCENNFLSLNSHSLYIETYLYSLIG